MQYKVGDKVKITNKDRHSFKEGTIVEILDVPFSDNSLYNLRGRGRDGTMCNQYVYKEQFTRIAEDIIKDCESVQEETTSEKILKQFSSEELLKEINRRMK